jgi:hypothetical protein
MPLGSSIKTSLVTATVTVGLLASALPAEARGLRGAFLPGLIGGLAFGAIAASAARAGQPANAYYADLPAELEGLPDWEETQPATRIRSLSGHVGPVRRPPQRRVNNLAGASALQLESCRNELASTSRPLGAVAVQVRGAGPKVRGRDGVVFIPLKARIEYARNGTRQVKQAQVTCQVTRNGQVAAFR